LSGNGLQRDKVTDIVAIRVLDEGECVVRDLVNKLDALLIRSVVDTALKDTAAVTVGRNLYAVGRDRVVDELLTVKGWLRMHPIGIPGCRRGPICSSIFG
jgi:hypothetical protein